MSEDNFYWNMYGGGDPAPKKADDINAREKMASRVAAGMKAQNAHTTTIDVGGQLVTLPKAEYVAQLEAQVREARNKVRELENKMQRLAKANNRIMEMLRNMDRELANKIDLR